MAKLLLGIDLGTGGCKVNIIDINGKWVASGTSEYLTTHQFPSWSEQDPDDWYIGFKKAFFKAINSGGVNAKDIVALGVDASTHNAVLLDSNMSVLRKTIMWTDQRSIEEVKWLNDNFKKEIFDITYQSPSPTWTLPQLLWIKKNEENIFNNIRYLMFTKDYLRYQLTGTWETDYIDAQGSMLADQSKKQWSGKICNIASIPLDILPPIKNPMDICGTVTKKASDETGIQEGTPVIVGTSDTAIESFGVGALKAGQGVVKMATAGTVNVFAKEAHPGPKSLTYPYVVPGLWYTCMATNSAAESLRWFRDVFGYEEISKSKIKNISSFALMDRAASLVGPGSDGLIFHPYLMGERSPYWDSNLRASFCGISSFHKKGHFSRAIMEGVSYSIMDCIRGLNEMDLSVDEIRFIGGAAKSPIWGDILSNVLGKPILTFENHDSSFGIAMLAGVGVGIFSSLTDAVKKCVRIKGEIKPDPLKVKLYGEYFKIYKKIHDDLVETYGQLARIKGLK